MLPYRFRWILFRAMVIFLPFGVGYLYSDVIMEDLIYAFDAILAVLYVDWIVRMIQNPQTRFHIKRTFLPGILMIAWSVFSMISAISLISAVFAIFMLTKALLMHVYLTNNIKTKKELKIVIFWLVVGLAFQSFLGLYERFAGKALGVNFLGEWLRVYTGELSRISGTFGFPNHLGAYLVMVIWFVIGMLLYNINRKFWPLQVLLVSGAALTIIFTFTRASWFGLAVSTLVVVFVILLKRGLSPNVARVLAGLLVVAIVTLIPVLNLIEERIGHGGDPYRMIMIRIALQMIRSNPIFGVGLFNNEYHAFQTFTFWKPVHNDYLRLAAETGIPGLAFFIWYLVLVFREAFRTLRSKDPYFKAVSIAVIGAYVGFCAIINIGPEYAFYPLTMLVWVIGSLPFCIMEIHYFHSASMKRAAAEKAAVSAGASAPANDPFHPLRGQGQPEGGNANAPQ